MVDLFFRSGVVALLLAVWPCLRALSQPVPVQLSWEAHYNGNAIVSSSDICKKMVMDPTGNCYIAGTTRTAFFAEDFLILKYSPAGQLMWSRRFNSSANVADVLKGIAVDGAGNLYATGSSSDPSYPATTIKFDAAGNLVWIAKARSFFDVERDANFPAGLAVDSNGSVLVAGSSGPDIVLIRYGADGSKLWTSRYPGSGGTLTSAGVSPSMAVAIPSLPVIRSRNMEPATA